MGLDSVELLMAWEDRFGISIPDEHAERLATTDDAVEYIYSALQNQDLGPCPTQRAFYRLRNAAAPLPARLRPSTPLEQLCPRAGRRALWPRLGAAVALGRMPELVRPRWFVFAATIPPAIAGITIALLVHAAIGLSAALLVTVWIVDLTRPLATQLPAGLRTTGDILRRLAPRGPLPDGTWTYALVRAAVRAAVIEQCGLPDDYADDASFVKDLGIQ